MADTVAQRIMAAVVAELALIPEMEGAKQAQSWDYLEQNFPYAWAYSLGEEAKPDEESGVINAVRSVGIEVVFEVGNRDNLEPEGERVLGLVQAQFGAAMTEPDTTQWRQLRRLTEYFDETASEIMHLPTERDAFLGVVATSWRGEYVRSFADPTAEG